MSKLETVTIANEDAKSGCTVINASDFDADTHEVFEDPSAPEEITRKTIDKMKKADVQEYLAAHGVTDATGNVGDLRKQLKQVMFVDA